MSGELSGGEDPEAALARYGAELVEGIERALPGWVAQRVAGLVGAWAGDVPAPVVEAARLAGVRARAEIGADLRALLSHDLDDQATTPLAVVRRAVAYPMEVLRQVGVPPVQRDGFAERAFPADVYDLAPATFADLDPDLADVALRWGAAKAFAHKRRHRGTPPAG